MAKRKTKTKAEKYLDPNSSAGVRTVQPTRKDIAPDISAGFSALVMTAQNVLINPDIAYRTNRQMADQMLRDPMVMAPLQKRMLATAGLEWQILPEDDEDANQKKICEELESDLRCTPRWMDMVRSLLLADFYGTGAVECYYEQHEQTNRWYVAKHRPHHGDKFVYDTSGNPRLLVKQNQTAGRELTPAEIDRLIIHVFEPTDGAFFEGAEAGYLFKGRGLRDLIWQYWWLKHNALRFWLNFMERYGGGMALGRYPAGNATAKTAIESVLRNMINDSRVSIPVPAGAEDKETYGVEVITVAGASENANLFKAFVEDWAGKHIRIIIEGQEQAHQETGDGMGSGRADALQDIFRMYVNADAKALADTITHQLLERLVFWNYGALDFKPRFEFILDDDDYEQAEKRVRAAKDIGLDVPKTWAYETLGVPQPKDGDEVLGFGEMAQEAHAAAIAPDPMSYADYTETAKARKVYSEALLERQ